MKLLPIFLALATHGASLVSSFAVAAETPALLERFKSYEQGKSVGELAATRQAVFLGTGDPAVRATREPELLAFIASDANPQAKAIAIEWLGSIGSAASVPGLIAAREIPALSAPVAAALERIPGPEAQQARLPKTAAPAAVSAAAAEVAAFTTALDKQPGSAAADALISGAMRSSNEILAGAAMQRIRTGAGSPALPPLLIGALAQMPKARQAVLLDALATRPGPAKELRAALIARSQVGDLEVRKSAILTLGRILQAADLELVLDLIADSELSSAATAALRRATDSTINSALRKLALASGPRSIAAIETLASRAAHEAVPDLWTLSSTQNAGISSAAFKALGLLISPGELDGLVKKVVAADGTPQAASLGQLTWNVLRRHPDPAAAANLLDSSATNAPAATKELLIRYATRIRPKGVAAAVAIPVNLPGNDDRRILAPNGHEEIAYMDCGASPDVRGSGDVVIRRSAGQAYQFGGTASPQHTMDFGNQVSYEITGLDANSEYVIGFTAWDADLAQRRQSFSADDMMLLPDFSPIAYHADLPTCARIHLPLPRAITADGKTVITMACLAGPNAVISELWLLRRTATTPAKRVVILTGDDFQGHLWRETGPEFAKILRSDPQLEVTISETPALLGSAVLSSYDAVFNHFKNYENRIPTTAPLWKNLEQYIHNGGGLVIAHFGCGAMQEWNGYVNIAGRVWDPNMRGHDPYGEFLVRILQNGHPVTKGIPDFTTTDELYTCLTGDAKIDVLAEATSKVDQSVHPMAFVLTPGKGRVFHSPLGHNLGALKAQGVRDLYLNATRWAAGLSK